MDKFFTDTSILLVVYFVLAAGFSFLIHSILLRFATTLGIRETKEMPVRWAKTQKPALGGISFYIVFLFSIAFYPVFFRGEPEPLSRQDIGLIAAATLAFLMGLADDAYDTRPWLKLFVQILCGLILSITGTNISVFENEYINHALTVFWVVGIMNSINMLDNMDAISTLVTMVIFISSILLRASNNVGEGIYLFALTGITASLTSFLYFNWFPSKMFMGDTGSQLLGVFLAATGVHACMGSHVVVPQNMEWLKLASLALLFCIPIADTTTVFINRISRGKLPFVGGKDHTTHSLFFKGITERRIAVLYTVLGGIGAILSDVLLDNSDKGFVFALIIFSYFILLFLTLFILNRITIR